MQDPQMQDWMHWQPTKASRFSWVVVTPARAIVGIGAIAAMIAGFMPWAQGRAPGHGGFEDVFFSGLGGSGDGVVLILVSLSAGLLTVHRTPATTRVRVVRVLPAVFVALAAITWLNGYRAAMLEIAAWGRRGGTGEIAPGLWIAGIGIVLMAAGTVVLLREVIFWKRRADDPTDVITFGLRDVAELGGGMLGVVVGAGLGIQGAVALTGPMVVGAIALGAVFGGLLGAYGGAWVGRTVVDRVRAARGGAGPA